MTIRTLRLRNYNTLRIADLVLTYAQLLVACLLRYHCFSGFPSNYADVQTWDCACAQWLIIRCSLPCTAIMLKRIGWLCLAWPVCYAAAALRTAYDIGFDPNVGLPALFLAVVAVIIGGRFSFIGPIVGAALLGVRAQSCVALFSAVAGGYYVRDANVIYSITSPGIICALYPAGGRYRMNYIIHLVI